MIVINQQSYPYHMALSPRQTTIETLWEVGNDPHASLKNNKLAI